MSLYSDDDNTVLYNSCGTFKRNVSEVNGLVGERLRSCSQEFNTFKMSTAAEQAVACSPVAQWARVRSPVGTSFLGEVFSGFFLTCKSNVRKL